MQHTSILGGSALLAALCLNVGTPAPHPAAQPQEPQQLVRAQEPGAAQPGHLVLVVEGTVRQLAITHAAQKPDAWAGAAKGLQSPFALQLLAADGKELLRVPLDLSRFDTDPRRIGGPVVVQGCEVRDWRIGVLCNVPRLPSCARYVFLRDGEPIGETSADALAKAIGGGR
jgi:hypothetical protein